MVKQKLTDKTVKTAVVPQGKAEAWVWDSEVQGFALRLRASGARTWMLKRGDDKHTLGNAFDRTVSDARTEAMTILAAIASGKPVGRHKRTTAPKMTDLMETYMKDHVAHHCVDSTAEDYRRTIDLHILPVLGKRTVDSIAAHDIDKLLGLLSGKPGAANKVLRLLKAAFQKGMRWGMRAQALGNPCTGALSFDLIVHEDYLEPDEFKILLGAMEDVSKRDNRWHASACLRLLAVTGCRRDEWRAALWAWVDFERTRVDWPNTKTGAGHLLLNDQAINLLRIVEAYNAQNGKPTSHIFQGEDHTLVLPTATLYRAWSEIKDLAAERGVDAARLKRLRPHDLRHSFATLGLSAGLTLDEVGKLLRHMDSRTTERYARFLPSAAAALAVRSNEFLTIEG